MNKDLIIEKGDTVLVYFSKPVPFGNRSPLWSDHIMQAVVEYVPCASGDSFHLVVPALNSVTKDRVMYLNPSNEAYAGMELVHKGDS